MKFLSLSEFFSKATAAFKRFPFTLVWAVVGTILIVSLMEYNMELLFDTNGRLILVLVLGISWLIGCQFYVEQFRKGDRLWWIKLIVVSLLVAFYFTLPEDASDNKNSIPYVRWLLLLIAGHLALFFAPFLTTWHPKAYWNYLSNMLLALARSALFAGVLYLGLVLAILAIRFLFNVDIDDKRYGQLFVVCLGIVNTWVYLSDFPKDIQLNIHLKFHKAIEVFVKFILIPLASLYFIILYAYTIKIVMQWELPKGWVSYLVTALAGLLFIIQLIIHPIRITHESRVIKRFQPLFYWLLLPLLPLLYVAIYKRITDYGFTEARYFLLLIAIFITGSALYIIFSRKQQLRFLPIVLCIFALAGSFGFWGAFSISKQSQLQQFEKVYYEVLPNGLSKVPTGDAPKISGETADRFKSIIRFLSSRESLHKTAPILGFDPTITFADASPWNMADRLLDSMGIEVTRNYSDEYRQFDSNPDDAISIVGYDLIKAMYFNANSRINNPDNILDGYRFSLLENEKVIAISKDQKRQLIIPINSLAERVLKLEQRYRLDREIMALEGANDSIAVKIYFTNMGFHKINDTLVFQNGRADVLLKSKR